MREEVIDKLKKMKGEKAAGLDVTVMEMLKNVDINTIKWLLKVNRCMKTDVARGLEGSGHCSGV